MSEKLIILDRDGVINEDSDDYIKSADEWIPVPGSLEAIGRLTQAGYKIAVVTNQSGIARGYYDLATLEAMHEKMRRLAAGFGGKIHKIVYCPHAPGDDCDCRKPKPGMLHQIADYFDTSLHGIVMVGDTPTDIQAARAVGATPVLVRTGKGERTLANPALAETLAGVPVYADLSALTDELLGD